jgi:hypothetical protein
MFPLRSRRMLSLLEPRKLWRLPRPRKLLRRRILLRLDPAVRRTRPLPASRKLKRGESSSRRE